MRSKVIRAAMAAATVLAFSVSALAEQRAVSVPTDAFSAAKFRSVTQSSSKILGANSASTNGVTPSEAYANPDRAYPASCLESPLPLGLYASDPNRVVSQILLPGDLYGDATEQAYAETVAVIVFRVVCSGGKSATLVEIDRPNNASTTNYPVVPAFLVTNASLPSGIVPRISEDPNTFYSNAYAGIPLFQSSVFVLENTFGGTIIDYNQPLSLYVSNLLSGPDASLQRFDLGAYTPSQYADASKALKINGYFSGNWYDKNHSGEGIQTEIGEVGTATSSRYLTVAWYTFDADGLPYWLFGSGVFTAGDRSVNVGLYYSSNGGFAGDFGAKTTSLLWGTMLVSFPDCNTIDFTYATTGVDIPAFVPQGSGTKTWKRLSNINGLTCQ
ncbi:MAG: hypothetical protein ABJB01_13215 [Rudaea sp.]